ncbi:hypothetical protein ES705_06882 [subsurface metagenome]|jgi:predicted HTH transcriptional regulator
MINKKLEEISISDLEALIENSVKESRTIEYKEILNLSSSDEKKKFLKQVSSFANASGGDIIFGIRTSKTDKRKPEVITGTTISSEDAKLLQINNIIRTGLQPRITEPKIQFIPFQDELYFIVIRVKRSFLSPHRVSIEGYNKFYSRGAAGKFEMSVEQL